MSAQKEELMQQFVGIMTKVRRFVDQTISLPQQDKAATLLQIQALTFLKDHPHTTVGELAQYLHMSSSAITQFVDRLVDGNFVRRENDPKDKRIVRLLLTTEGEVRLMFLLKVVKERMKRVLTHIPEEDLKEMVRILGNLIRDLEKQK